MAVQNGQPVNQEVTNAAFLSRTQDSDTTGNLGLNNAASGNAVVSIQKAINKAFEGLGCNGEDDNAVNQYTDPKYIGSANRKLAIEALDNQLFLTQTDLDAAEAELAAQAVIVNALSSEINNLDNSNIVPGAGIELSKLETVTADRALVSDASGVVTPSGVSSTELSYLSGATSNIQAQLNGMSGLGAVQTKTANYTVLVTDSLILCNSAGGAFTITLYSPVGNAGKEVKVMKTDTTFTQVNVTGTGLTVVLSTQGDSISVISDGSTWILVDRRIPSTELSYSLTSGSFSNLGTVSSIQNVSAVRDGRYLLLSLRFICGTTTGSQAAMALPTGLAVASTMTSFGVVGYCHRNANVMEVGVLTASPGDTVLKFAQIHSSSNWANASAANSMLAATDNVTVHGVRVAIQGWEG